MQEGEQVGERQGFILAFESVVEEIDVSVAVEGVQLGVDEPWQIFNVYPALPPDVNALLLEVRRSQLFWIELLPNLWVPVVFTR